MLALTRPHRQAMATLAVVLFSMAPTAFVASTLVRLNRPEHVREVERELGRRLNLHVSIGSVRHPKPGEDVITGLVVRAEEPGRKGTPPVEIARASGLRLRRDGRDWAVEADGLTLGGEGPSQSVAQIAALLGRASDAEADRISLSADACSVALGRGLNYDLKSLAGLLTVRGDRRGPVLSASYRIAGDGASTRCEMSVSRERGA